MKNYLIMFFINAKQFGIDIVLFVAGTAGGIALLTKSPKLTTWQKFTSVLTGGFTANYLTPLAAHWLNLSDDLSYGIAFLLGYGGLKSVETLFIALMDRIERKKSKNDDNT